MRTFGAILQMEMRLTWRRRSFWIVQGLILITGLKLMFSDVPERIVLGFVTDEIYSLLTLELILLPILVGPAITRDLNAVGDLLWTTSLDALNHVVGVIGGLWLILLPALVIQVGARWLIVCLVHGVWAPLFLVYGLPPVVISVSMSLGLVVLLAILLRRTLSLLFLWSVLSFGMLAWAKMTSPLNIGFSRLQLSPALGLGLYRSFVYSLSLWFIGIGLMMVPLVIGVSLFADQRRAVRRFVPLGGWALVASLVMGLGYAWHAQTVAAQATPDPPPAVQLDAWIVRAHTLQAVVDAEHNLIAGVSTLSLEPVGAAPAREILLCLNPGLVLDEAQDGTGRTLVTTRLGASVAVSSLTPSPGPLTLKLSWQGTPRLASADYTGGWDEASRPVRALLTQGIGYLLRDGDWYPWPCTTRPRQTERNQMTLQVSGGEALASAPTRDGKYHWDGLLPSVLLVFPPADRYNLPTTVLHVGRDPILAGPRLLERLKSFGPAALGLSRALGEAQPPAHTVACPYLGDFVWSENLLLVPEGTGYLDWNGAMLAFWRGAAPAVEERAALTVLARAWLLAYLSPPETPDTILPGGGRRLHFSDDDQLDALALWIALELADPAVREADLELVQEIAALDVALQGADWRGTMKQRNQLWQRLRDRRMSADLIDRQGNSALLLALHRWTLAVGSERALLLLGDVVRAGGTFNVQLLLDELGRVSGVPVQ